MEQTMSHPTKIEHAAEFISVANEEAVIEAALAILRARVKREARIEGPADVRRYLAVYAAKADTLNREEFNVVWLDAQHGVLLTECVATGTVSSCSIHPREIVRAALRAGASAAILHHNHPSGVAEPSRADEMLTEQLKAALALVGVRVLDHVVTAGGASVSMAERGLI